MRKRHRAVAKQPSRSRQVDLVLSPRSRRGLEHGKRVRGWERCASPFVPPEDWYEPGQRGGTPEYEVVVQEPGEGYRHAVTAADVRHRLARLPQHMLEPLEVVQLSRMTRKKRTYPCYGMQWGSALYLYPIETSMIEYFSRPPLPAEHREAAMFGGRWEQRGGRSWRLIWTRRTIRDFYLNNVLLHELGHLLDDRNTGYADRERFAEWFAIEHGYKASRRAAGDSRRSRRVIHRHGSRR